MEHTKTLFPDCDLAMSAYSFCVHAPNKAFAFGLIKEFRAIAAMAKRLLKREALIYYPGCSQPIQIPAEMAMTGFDGCDVEQQAILLGADYCRIHEFLVEQRQEGNIVIITSNTTNICYHTNDMLLPSRAVWSAKQFTGYNYLRSWRARREDNPENPASLNPQFDRLRSLLASEGQVKGYEYQLYRTDDARCSYLTDFYLCQDYCGDEVRIGVSRPQDWALLEAVDAIA